MQEESGSRFDVTLEPEDTVIDAQDGAAFEAQGKEEGGSRFDVTLEPEDAVIEAQKDIVLEVQEKADAVIETQEDAVAGAQYEATDSLQDPTVLHASPRSAKREMWLKKMVPEG